MTRSSRLGSPENKVGNHCLKRVNYNFHWSAFREWCRDTSHSCSCPTLSKVTNFLFYRHQSEKAVGLSDQGLQINAEI